MQHILSSHTWVSLTSEQRAKLRGIFGIPRSGDTIVNDGRIETDGTTVEDLRHLTVEKMQAYTSNDSQDFHKLFDVTLARVQDEIEGKPFEVIEPVIEINAKPHAKTKKSKQE